MAKATTSGKWWIVLDQDLIWQHPDVKGTDEAAAHGRAQPWAAVVQAEDEAGAAVAYAEERGWETGQTERVFVAPWSWGSVHDLTVKVNAEVTVDVQKAEKLKAPEVIAFLVRTVIVAIGCSAAGGAAGLLAVYAWDWDPLLVWGLVAAGLFFAYAVLDELAERRRDEA